MIHGGKLPGITALLLEISKGIICFVLAHYLVGETWATLVLLVAAVFGCNWSVWLRGGGGQGLTIGISGLVLLDPRPILIMAVFYLLPMLTTKRHLLSNRLFRLSLPIILLIWYGSWEHFLAGFLIVIPSFIKGWIYGDDVVEAKKADSVNHSGAGAL
jgi:glycerol-3-phosphate acyltransferase PlsY